jgi:hypothetical protein
MEALTLLTQKLEQLTSKGFNSDVRIKSLQTRDSSIYQISKNHFIWRPFLFKTILDYDTTYFVNLHLRNNFSLDYSENNKATANIIKKSTKVHSFQDVSFLNSRSMPDYTEDPLMSYLIKAFLNKAFNTDQLIELTFFLNNKLQPIVIDLLREEE